MKTKEEIFKLIMSEPDESVLIVELSEQIDQQFKRIEELEAALSLRKNEELTRLLQ